MIDRRHHRASIRLRGYDYAAPGAYFVTIVTHGRSTWFGELADGAVRLNPIGQITQEVWEGLPNHYEYVQVDAFVVMPNHVHGIIVLTADVGVGTNAWRVQSAFVIIAPRWRKAPQESSP